MSELPLKEAVREHVNTKRLSDAQYGALMELQAQHAVQEPQRKVWKGWLVAVAAVVLACLGAVLWQTSAAPDVHQAIVAEVTKNHLKLKPLEVTSHRMARTDPRRPRRLACSLGLPRPPRGR